MIVDFRLVNVTIENAVLSPKSINIKFVNGQFIGLFTEKDQFVSKINYKYKYTYNVKDSNDKIKRTVNGVQSILIDTEPGTIIKLRTTVMDDQERFIVNETGQLNFDTNDPAISIKSLKIIGRNFNLSDFNQKENPISSLENIISPRHMDLYQIQNTNNWYVYYNQKFYQAEKREDNTVDLYYPIDALVFYFAAIKEETY